MNKAAVMIGAAVLACGAGAYVLVSSGVFAPDVVEQAAGKAQPDEALLALPYPASSGELPPSIQLSYDESDDRSHMTLRFSAIKAAGPAVSDMGLILRSSYDGKTRSTDDPEGSAEGTLTARCAAAGVLAYSGAPGTAVIDGQSMDMRTRKGGYTSVQAGGAWEETLRFKFPTEVLVAAAAAESVVLKFGLVEITLTEGQLKDLREFAARMNPKAGAG